MEVLTKAKAPVSKELKPLREAYDKANNEYIAAMKAKKNSVTLASLKNAATTAMGAMDPCHEKIQAIDKDFMDKHPRSLVTASLLRYRISSILCLKQKSVMLRLATIQRTALWARL